MAITPPLVNAHIHLELSHLAELGQGTPPASFTGWILDLITLRDRLGAVGEDVSKAAAQVLDAQYASGVSVVADIGNTAIGNGLQSSFGGTLLAYREYLGFSDEFLAANLARLDAETASTLCAAHAVYSTHRDLLRHLKQRAERQGAVLPIHVAETVAEIEMITHGSGEIVDFLVQRGFWEEGFLQEIATVEGGVVTYLARLDLLNERTLCVHGVHVSKEETALLAAAGAKVCLCPGSNRFLGVGRAPVQHYLDAGILPALGTDSLASNPELSIWREMQLLQRDHPFLDPQDIFAMATRGGAEALGVDRLTGTLAEGRKAELLAVPLPGEMKDAAAVYRHLVGMGSRINPTRIDERGGK